MFSSASHLKLRIKDEKNSEEKILERANKKYLFFNSFGKAAFSVELIKIEKTKNWMLEGQNVKISVEQNTIGISWELNEEKHNIGGVILNNTMSITYKKPKRIIYHYSGEDKYTYTDHEGYGYLDSPQYIICFFEIDKKINEFHFEAL